MPTIPSPLMLVGIPKHINLIFLKSLLNLKNAGIRTSIFLDPKPELCEYAAKTGTDEIELYTEAYAKDCLKNKNSSSPYLKTAIEANKCGLGINAEGHDLSLENLEYFAKTIPNLLGISLYALDSEAIYMGMEKQFKPI